jgi:hypothetical protein
MVGGVFYFVFLFLIFVFDDFIRSYQRSAAGGGVINQNSADIIDVAIRTPSALLKAADHLANCVLNRSAIECINIYYQISRQ